MVLEDATCQGSQEMDAFKWVQIALGTVPTPEAQCLSTWRDSRSVCWCLGAPFIRGLTRESVSRLEIPKLRMLSPTSAFIEFSILPEHDSETFFLS